MKPAASLSSAFEKDFTNALTDYSEPPVTQKVGHAIHITGKPRGVEIERGAYLSMPK